MFPANCIHQEVEMLLADLLPLSSLRPQKSRTRQPFFFLFVFLCFMCFIYSTNSYEFLMYIIKLNRIVLRNLLSITLQQVFLFVNKEFQQNLFYVHMCTSVSVYMCTYRLSPFILLIRK